MAKIGPKEMQQRALQARRVGKESTEAPRASVPAKTEAAPAAQRKETTMSKKSKKKPAGPKPKRRSVSEAAANLKAGRAASKAAAKAAGDGFEKAERAEQGPRAGSKLAIVVGLLTRTAGCTTKDVLTATGWPTVSMPQQAKAAGLKLRKEKDGKVSRYFGAAA